MKYATIQLPKLAMYSDETSQDKLKTHNIDSELLLTRCMANCEWKHFYFTMPISIN